MPTERSLTYWAEVSHEQSLLPILDNLGHELVDHEDGRYASEHEDEDAESDEATDSDAGDIWLVESLPWHDGSDVHETAEVQEDIDTAVDLVVSLFSFLEELAIPVQGVSCDEACEEIIGPEHTADSDSKQL